MFASQLQAFSGILFPTASAAILATPFVRGLAKRSNVDLNSVKPTGKFGNITEDDVNNFLMKPTQAPVGQSQPQEAYPKPISVTPHYDFMPIEMLPDDYTEPIRGLKRTMVKTMSISSMVPHMGVYDDFYVDKLIALRDVLKPIAQEKGVKLSYTAFFIKAASLAIKSFPIVNSTLSLDHKSIVYHRAHNIGIAMDTPAGLIVPNIKHCEQKSIFDIAEDLKRLADLGSQGKLSGDDLKHGTFTLSNIGAIGGGVYARPVLMPNETCIAAISDFKKYPRVDEKTNQVVVKSVMHISWSCDHRTVEGATLLRFSNKMKTFVENPTLMLTECC